MNNTAFSTTRLVVVILLLLTLPPAGVLSSAPDDDRRRAAQAAATSSPASGRIVDETPALRSLIDHYRADEAALERYYPIPLSSARRARFRSLHQEWLRNLAEIDFGKLSLDGQVDYTLLKNYLDRQLRKLDAEATAAAEMEFLLPFAARIVELHEDLQQMRWIEGAKAAAALTDLNKQIVATQASLERRLAQEGRAENAGAVIGIKRIVARDAASMVAVLRKGLDDWFAFYNDYDPLFTWWVAEPYKATGQALQSYIDFLRTELVGVKGDVEPIILMDPVGRDALMRELAFEMIPYTPEELLDLAWQELAWCEKERIAASRELGFGDDWRKAMEHVKDRHVEPGQQPELIRHLAVEAIEFLVKHDSITIPKLVKDIFRIRMTSPEEQRIIPYFGGGEETHVAFPTSTMPHVSKVQSLRGNNRHFSRAVVHHEIVPGHHLQSFMTMRHRAYRTLFATPFFYEGWSLYWEMRLWDMNFQRSPEDRIGMLFWRIHRCARIIFSLSFQLGKMTGQECIDLVANRVGMEPEHAAIEGTRSLDRGMGLVHMSSYLVGGLQIRALSRELVDSGKMTEKVFHDAMLLENSIPIELVRAKLMNQKLDRNFVPKWKFYTFSK